MLEFAVNTLLVECHWDNLRGLICGQVNRDSLGGLHAATHAGDPGNGLLFTHVEDKRCRQRIERDLGGERLLRILDRGRN